MRLNFFYIALALPVVCRAQARQGQPGSTIGVSYFKQVNFRNSTEDGIGLQYVSNRLANGTWVAALNASFNNNNPSATTHAAGALVLDAEIFYRHNVGKEDQKFKPFYFAGGALAFETSGLHAFFPAGAGVTCRLSSIFIEPAIQYNIESGKSERNRLRIGVTVSGILSRRFQKIQIVHPGSSDMLASNEATGRVSKVVKNTAPSVDRDGDGIADSIDACPLVPGVRQFNGCPVPDADGDGVDDNNDSCKTLPGPTDNKGCPLPPVSLQSFLSEQSRQIHFKTGSDALLPSALPVLDSIAKLLLEYTEIRLAIYGHADATGNAAMNQALSEKRAKAVYL